jgi:ASPIC and UnbV/Secretion system C-terminal sorting domain/FG-GAP-like repeat
MKQKLPNFIKCSSILLLLLGFAEVKAQTGETCAEAIPLDLSILPLEVNGTTNGMNYDYDTQEICGAGGGNNGAPDAVYSIIPTQSGSYNFSFCNSEYDTRVLIYEGDCNQGSEIACNDDNELCYDGENDNSAYKSTVGVYLLSGEEFFIVVSGYSVADSGNFNVVITLLPPPEPGDYLFLESSYLLANQSHFSGNSVGVADMNGDRKDDIVRLDENRHFNIEYQNSGDTPFTLFDPEIETSGNNEWALAIGDADNNGFNDLIAAGYHNGMKLYTASDDGTEYTLEYIPYDTIFAQGINFADINNDGDLDIFACHDDGESEKWENTGDGNFIVNASLLDASVGGDPGEASSGNYASIWTDFDSDGDVDLYISKCRQGVSDPVDSRRWNMLFVNDGNENYTEMAADFGLRDSAQSWASDFGDVDNDGDMDVYVINHDFYSKLFINDNNQNFIQIPEGTFGVNEVGAFAIENSFEDFDNDGFLDLIVGYAYPDGLIDQSKLRIWEGNGDGTFTYITNPFGENNMMSYALGDLNTDGFIDVYGCNSEIFNNPSSIGLPDQLFMNQGNENNFITYTLEGSYSNASAIGARVTIYGAWGTQIREVRSGVGYGIQNSFACHFGLGTATVIDSTVIHFPSGIEMVFVNDAINQFHHVIEEGELVSVGENTSSSILSVYPNPASQTINVQVGNGEFKIQQALTILVYDANGRVVNLIEGIKSNNIEIKRENLPAGNYFIELKNNKNILAKTAIVFE